MISGTVKSRVKDFEGHPIRKADKNAILDTRVYKVEFSDGENAELGANIITECMYAQCDIEGNQYRLWITFTLLLPSDEGTNDMSFSLT